MKIKFNEAQFGNISVENQEKLQITIPDILTNKKIRKNNDAWTSDSDVQKSDFGTIYSYFFVHNCGKLFKFHKKGCVFKLLSYDD